MSPDPGYGDFDRALSALDRGPGIPEPELARLVEWVSARYEAPILEDYVAFLTASNGADGTFENGMPIVLWSGDLLPSVNADLNVEDEMPGCLVIGSDAGDLLYGIDLRVDAPPERYVETEDASMAWD